MIGFTAPIPLETLIAAGRQPVDLRQLFLGAENPAEIFEEADLAGFDPGCDSWLKGFYGSILRYGIREVVVVTNDQSGLSELVALLKMHDVRVIPFSYPIDRSAESLALEIKKLARHFDASPVEIDHARQQLNLIREKIHRIEHRYRQRPHGNCRHIIELQQAAYDMQGDPTAFSRKVDNFPGEFERRPHRSSLLRLACFGEIPMCGNLYETLEELGATVVYSEQGRQASMPFQTDSLVEQYLQFTLPYGIFPRTEFCRKDLEEDPVDGILLFNSTAPTRRLGEMLMRQQFKQPLLCLPNLRPGELDAASRTALEGFIEDLRNRE